MSNNLGKNEEEFYLRYYTGKYGNQFGHEFLEFECFQDGHLIYVNNSKYKKDQPIKKELYITRAILDHLKKMIEESDILSFDDYDWPEPSSKDGKQELEIVYHNYHISFSTSMISTVGETMKSRDAEGLKCYYYLVHELKSFMLTIMNLHFKVKPI